MKSLLWIGLSLLGVAIGVLVLSARHTDAPDTSRINPLRSPMTGPLTVTPGATVRTVPAFKSLPAVDQSRPADFSLQWAREHGDSRTPPLRRVPETEHPPTAEQLADPKAYADYEQQQKLRTYANYVQAANAEIPKLEQQLEQAKSMGIPPDKLAVGQEKLQRIQQMRDQLQSTYPQLSGMTTPAAASPEVPAAQ